MSIVGIYRYRVLPRLIDLVMRNRTLTAYRQRLVSAAEGRVLEIGVGSGLNLPLYSERASHVIGLDPSFELLAMARDAAKRSAVPVSLLNGSAEAVPLEDGSIDCVVTTWTLCSIPDVEQALAEVRRVLRPGGAFLFVEHGLAPGPGVQRWQHRLTPAWKRIGGGCHLGRAPDRLLASAGLHVTDLETGYMKGPRPMTFMYEGRARSRSSPRSGCPDAEGRSANPRGPNRDLNPRG